MTGFTENSEGARATNGDDTPESNERRKALKKIAVYSAYAAPALLALSKPAKAVPGSILF